MDDDAEFLRAFETTTLPKPDWTHRAHIRMAWLYLERHPFRMALDLIRSGIRRYNAVHGVPDAYHETVTIAFAHVVRHRRLVSPVGICFEAFAILHPDLFVRAPSPLLAHYDERTLASPEARASFVPPDRAPFPSFDADAADNALSQSK